MPAALLFDLDETLVLEEPAAVAAFEATAGTVPGVDAARLAVAARSHARTLWYAAPTHPYCRAIGISSWEGLCCRFEGEGDDVALRAWAPAYRRAAWAAALADQGIDEPSLATELGERFAAERRARHETFDDVPDALDRLADAVWINRFDHGPGRDGVPEIASLAELPAVLSTLTTRSPRCP